MAQGKIKNADIASGAAIDRAKLAAGTANGVVVNDGSGAMTSVAPGTSGNVLTSNGTTWVSSASSGGLPTATNTGDIVRWNGSAWAAAQPGGRDSVPFRGTSPFEVFYPVDGAFNSTSAAMPINTLRAGLFTAGASGMLDRLMIFVGSVGAAGAVCRVGIYSNLSTAYPGSLLVDGGEFSTASGIPSSIITRTISQAVVADTKYWFVMLCGVASFTPIVRNVSQGQPIGWLGDGNYNTPFHGLSVAQAYGALPSSFPAGASAVTTASQIPLILARYA